MKIGWLIVGGAAAYLVYKTYYLAKAISTFNYSIKSVRINASNSSFFKTELAVTLIVNNVTPQPISFQSFIGTVNVKGVPVALFRINQGNGISIKPGANELMFPVEINHLNLAADISTLIKTWNQNDDAALVSINGDVTAGGVSVPVNQTLLLNQDAIINGIGELMVSTSEMPGFLMYSNY